MRPALNWRSVCLSLCMHLTASFELTRWSACNTKHTRNMVWINFKQNGFIIDIMVITSYVWRYVCNLIDCFVYLIALPIPEFIIITLWSWLIVPKNHKGKNDMIKDNVEDFRVFHNKQNKNIYNHPYLIII